MILKNDNVPFPMAYLIETRNNNVGHLFQLPNFKTSTDGVIVYMELADDLDETLAKVESAEGKIIYGQNTYYTRQRILGLVYRLRGKQTGPSF